MSATLPSAQLRKERNCMEQFCSRILLCTSYCRLFVIVDDNVGVVLQKVFCVSVLTVLSVVHCIWLVP